MENSNSINMSAQEQLVVDEASQFGGLSSQDPECSEHKLSGQNNLKPLQLGRLKVWPPVVLAPMAGITHYPFRKLCRSFGSCLTVSEMVTARPLVENNIKTLKIAQFGKDESPRSIQLYGIDPKFIGLAVKRLVNEGLVDHIDLNFGCPVKKVTRRGGGAALPYKTKLLENIIKQAVTNAQDVPVTVKCRMGIDQNILTYLDTGRIAQEEGASAIALHARTAAQMYSGKANWNAIKNLKQNIKHIPVLGNGDIFIAQDAIDMIKTTGCDGVVIGRGCLGRPWLFRDMQNLLENNPIEPQPNLKIVIDVMLQHLDYMIDWFGESRALLKFRKDACYYLKGFRSSSVIRALIMSVSSKSELLELLFEQSTLDLTEPYPVHIMTEAKAKSGRSQIVTLPHGFLDSKEDLISLDQAAESDISGG